MEPRHRDLPVGMRFRPTDLEMADYFLTYKVLRRTMKARTIPEERPDIFSRDPRDLPGNSREREDHWYFYCRKTSHVTNNSHNIWIPIGGETDVLNPKKNGELAGIKRSFAFVENEEYDSNCFSDEEEPPKYNWFMDEISLPSTVADTDWVLCHIFCKKVKPEFVDLPESDSESESESESESKEDEAKESDDKPAESLDFFREKDENVPPPPPLDSL